MGISDRDYARAGPSSVSHRSGNHGIFSSVTGWLIAINVIVFILNNMVLAHTPRLTTWGISHEPGATPEQIQRAVRDSSQMYALSNAPGVTYQNLVDPKTRQVVAHQRYTQRPILDAWWHFSTGKFYSEGQVWRVLTFQFLHSGPVHLLFNMMGLFFVGGLVESYLGSRRFLAFYLLCGVAGALLFMLLNLAGYLVSSLVSPQAAAGLPLLLVTDVYTPLIGASAGVFGVLLAAAFIAPTSMVAVAFILPMKMKTAVYLFVALALMNLITNGANAGGDAAHIGGAIAGAWLIRRTDVLRDVTTLFGLLGSGGGRASQPSSRRASRVDEVDRILTKVREHGLDSLNTSERASLRRESQRGGGAGGGRG